MSQRGNKEKAPTGDYPMHFNNELSTIAAHYGFSSLFGRKTPSSGSDPGSRYGKMRSGELKAKEISNESNRS